LEGGEAQLLGPVSELSHHNTVGSFFLERSVALNYDVRKNVRLQLLQRWDGRRRKLRFQGELLYETLTQLVCIPALLLSAVLELNFSVFLSFLPQNQGVPLILMEVLFPPEVEDAVEVVLDGDPVQLVARDQRLLLLV